MNNLRKRAAVTKYLPLISEGKTETEIKAAIANDEKGYTEAEIDEIYQSLLNPEPVAPSAKYKVNFGVEIPEFGKAFTKEEIEADEDVINYLVEIKSGAVTVLKEGTE